MALKHVWKAAAVAVMAGVVMSSGSAKADNFFFSFSNVGGNVAGTVSGEIFGLTNNLSSAASDVIVTSYPAGLNSTFPAGTIDTGLWNDPIANAFTETNGQITAASFKIEDMVNNGIDQLYIDFISANVLQIDQVNGKSVENTNGLSGVNFSAAPASVPEAPSWSIFAVALAALGAASQWRRRLS